MSELTATAWKPADPVERLKVLHTWLGDEIQEGTFKETVAVMDVRRQLDDAIDRAKLAARGLPPEGASQA